MKIIFKRKENDDKPKVFNTLNGFSLFLCFLGNGEFKKINKEVNKKFKCIKDNEIIIYLFSITNRHILLTVTNEADKLIMYASIDF